MEGRKWDWLQYEGLYLQKFGIENWESVDWRGEVKARTCRSYLISVGKSGVRRRSVVLYLSVGKEKNQISTCK